MKNGCIAVIDSGIGGLNLFNELVTSFPDYTFIYYGDNKNAPYGNRTKRDLLEKTFAIVCELVNYNVSCVVMACNTLSISVLSDLMVLFPKIKFFGVFPPVERGVVLKKKTLLLCTSNTAKGYKPTTWLDIMILPTLAKMIEDNRFSLEKVNFSSELKRGRLLSLTKNPTKTILTTKRTFLTTKNRFDIFDHQVCPYNTIILGCTHYNFVKNKIFNHFQPQRIVSGEDFTKKMVSEYLQNNNSLEKYKRKCILFLGETAKENEEFYALYFKSNSNLLQKNRKK